jgi:cold shock CspA family protein
MRHTGVLKSFNFDRGYGFIYQRAELPDGKFTVKCFFAHISKIVSGEPEIGATAHFSVAPGKAGKGEQAIEIEIENGGAK